MSSGVPLKLAQLMALPVALVVVSVVKAPRHGRPPGPGAEPDTVTAVQAADRFFAGRAAPSIPIDLEKVAASVATPASSTWFQVTVVAELPDDVAAVRMAGDIEELLASAARHVEESSSDEVRARLLDARSAAPLTPPEAAAFARRGVRSEVGIGWPGARKDARSAVVRLGRVLAVPGLKGDFAGLRPNPLAALLEASGARVLVEGDPAGGAQPALDLTCDAADEAAAGRLARSLDHYLRAPRSLFLRPPWHPLPVSAEQEGARATLLGVERAVRAALADPHIFDSVRDRIHTGSRDAGEIGRVLEEIRRERALEALEAVARRPGTDPVVVDELRKFHGGPSTATFDPATRRRLSERLGSLAVEVGAPRTPGAAATVEPTSDERAFGASGRVQVEGRRVSLGRLVFHRFAHGLPALLLELRAAGCSGAKLGLLRDAPARRFVPDSDELEDPEGD